MSGSLSKTKRRILSIEATEKTTKAMELISSVKLKRFSRAKELSSLYRRKLMDVMGYLYRKEGEKALPYLKENEGEVPTLYLAIGSSMGLCGSYNGDMFKFIERTVSKDDILAPIGTKLLTHYERSPIYPHLRKEFADLDNNLSFEALLPVAKALLAEYQEGKIKKIVLLFTSYRNGFSFQPLALRLLPLSQIQVEEGLTEAYCPPLLDEAREELIEHLLPEYLASLLYRSLLEAGLSEQGSRRNAMHQANENADELLRKLNIEYNKARQGAITQEITEVIGGASASGKQ